ncbi:MAG TPA: glycoside hydrolase family 38 C-terminal domain-containing protein [Gaiellaceae bacterium]|nr:glycoside hydrolase family 38 C-terminal domain-containing protein [Gaiellaceae bacterium]
MRALSTSVFLVPHTHWDREWHRPFQSFRMSLVDVVDEVLDRLEADPTLRFTLDGQLATVDDYLEIRPEGEGRIRRLVGEGRLALGPWLTLVDEFLVDGETTLRNLEAGLRRAAEFGEAMQVGYLPDMFGHVAQMPQILRAAGIETAVVWRGVPAAVDFHRFVWEGLDGSAVVAEYLPAGYGNAAYIFEVPGEVSLAPLEERFRPWFGGDRVLGMVGTDHMPLVHDFAQRVPPGAHVGTLGEYLADAAETGLGRWRGEMRSAARANLLPGVVSARIDLKAACARAERWLERYAEPLQALYGTDWPEPFLAEAWLRMFQNAAHDSICGCSADEVSAQVLVRYAEAEQIGRELAQRAVARIAAKVPKDAFAVVNPSPRERTDLVELEVRVEEDWETVELELRDGPRVPTQEIGRQEPFLWETRVAAPEVPLTVARRLHGRELFGRFVNGLRIDVGTATLEVGDEPDPDYLDVEALVRELTLAAAEGEWTLRVVSQPRRRVVAAVTAPPLGWTSVRSVRGRGTVPRTGPLQEVTQLTRIVRGKDVGDSYNYAPPPDDVLIDTPADERLERVEEGALRTVDVLHRAYVWDGKRVETRTRFEQRAGEPFVRIRIDFDNQCDDQRVRVHVPLRAAADHSRAQGQFGVVERGLEPEGGYGEVPIPTYPASAFVAAGGVALLLDQVTEYELTGGELALTILRSTGLISRHDNPWREDPAGPSLPIPAAQMRGPQTFSFAYLASADSVHEQAERYRHPLLTARGTAAGRKLGATAGPALEGDERVVLTALQPGWARLVNESADEQAVRFAGRELVLRPWEIRTSSF